MLTNFRLRAFAIHFLISLAIVLLTGFFVFVLWYPSPLHTAVGIISIYLTMLFVDVVIGPVLTLAVAKKGKKGLKQDFLVIACLQIIALAYGIHSIYMNRPVKIVYYMDMFELVQRSTVDMNSLEKASTENKKLRVSGYDYAMVEEPKNSKDRIDRMYYEFKTGHAPAMRPHMYRNIKHSWKYIINHEKKLTELKELKQNVDLEKAPFVKATGWIPLKAYDEGKVVLVNSKTKKIIKIVDINPWPSK